MDTIFGISADTLLIALAILLALIGVIMAVTAIRHPVPFRLGLRNLGRRKSQTLLIIAGLALSTIIITSALGIGDTVDSSVKSDVYQNLGAIDVQISRVEPESAQGFGFGSGGPAVSANVAQWFDGDIASKVAGLVDGSVLDAAVPIAIESLPVLNNRTNLSEPSVEIRGIGPIAGEGLVAPAGLEKLGDDQILVNGSLAESLDAQIGDELLLVNGRPAAFEIAGIVADGELAGGQPAAIWSLAQAQTFFSKPNQINTLYVSNVGDAESGVINTAAAESALEAVAGELSVTAVKADQLEAAASGAEFITTLFVTFGTFSIFSGILLIFLIFSVLAAERRSELGMSRAVGLQRRDLIRQFVTEGLAYNFVAALIGASIGVIVALLLAGTISSLLGNSQLSITPRVSPRSALIGYGLGLVITFGTVTLSAVRISRVNIIAAIRDLNLPSLPRESQWTLFLRPFTVWRAALQKAGLGNRREALRLFFLAGPKAVLSFWIGLLARGPVLMALGYLFAWVGVNVAEQSGVYGLGVSLFFIGLGQLAAWLLTSARVAYSLSGLALVLYWSLPTRDVGKLAELNQNPGDFFISGIFLVGGAIMLFLYNSDSLLNFFASLLSRLGRLLPVTRVSIAYPVKAKSRTATTLAMFSLVVFTLVGTTTITNTFSNFLDVESGSGGYDILAQANPFNLITPEEIREAIDGLVSEGSIAEPLSLADSVFAPVQAQSQNMITPSGYAINGVDEAFLNSQQLVLANIAEGFEDEEAVWSALATDPSLVVIDNFSIDRGGDPTYQPDAEAFAVTSIEAGATAFEPTTIQITGLNGVVQEFTVVGVLGSAPSFYGAMMNLDAAASLGYLDANRFYLRLPEGSDVRGAANAIESQFNRSGLQTTLLKEQVSESQQAIRSIFYLIQGFIALGLLIGIAALGVVTIRAVVERRQQIGVLRAIGFHRSMVQGVFLFEGLFVSGLGTLIGYALALSFAYNLYLQVAADQGLAFLPPWPTLTAIAATILVASLLTSWLPSRATAKVTIAEALRYE